MREQSVTHLETRNMTSWTIITQYMAFKQYNFIRNSASFQSRCWSIYGRTCSIFEEMNKRVPLPVGARLSLRMKALCYCSAYQSVLFLAVFICSISRALMGVCMCVCT